MKHKIFTIWLTIIIFMLIAPFAYSQIGIDPSLKPKNLPGVPVMTQEQCEEIGGEWIAGKKMCKYAEEATANLFLQKLASALLAISGGLGVIVISVGGLLYVTSRGNQQQLDFAKTTLVYGIIGMLVTIFSYFIVKYVLVLIIGG
jgi:hypothetical protein